MPRAIAIAVVLFHTAGIGGARSLGAATRKHQFLAANEKIRAKSTFFCSALFAKWFVHCLLFVCYFFVVLKRCFCELLLLSKWLQAGKQIELTRPLPTHSIPFATPENSQLICQDLAAFQGPAWAAFMIALIFDYSFSNCQHSDRHFKATRHRSN